MQTRAGDEFLFLSAYIFAGSHPLSLQGSPSKTTLKSHKSLDSLALQRTCEEMGPTRDFGWTPGF